MFILMRIGVFSQINGDYSRLESILGNMQRKKLDHVYFLGNLIEPRDKKNRLSLNDIECSLLLKAYQNNGLSLYALKGINEENYLEDSEDVTSSREDDIKKFIESFHPNQFLLENGFVYSFIFDGFGIHGKEQSRKLADQKDQRFNYLLRDSMHFNRNTRIVFLGDSLEQEFYVKERHAITKKVFKSHVEMILPLADPDFLGAVVCPSSKHDGYMILDHNSVEIYQ